MTEFNGNSSSSGDGLMNCDFSSQDQTMQSSTQIIQKKVQLKQDQKSLEEQKAKLLALKEK